MYKATILIIEDDINIMYAIKEALEIYMYNVLTADTLSKARDMMRKYTPELIILDIMLPDGNGLTYCEEVRGQSGVRILFISALNTKKYILSGLKAGGDDYISKPFYMEELILRVEALLRRGNLLESGSQIFKAGDVELNLLTRRAFAKGNDIGLTPKEFAVLEILARSFGKSVAAKDIYEKVWGMNPSTDVRTVKEHISRLRNKLKGNCELKVESERGKGYALRNSG